AAAEALGNIGTADAIPLLEPLLRDYDGESQLVATEALGKIVTEKDIYILAPLLMDKAKYVRSAAAEALGNIGTANAIPLLEPLLKDDDEYVRSVAASALGDIGLLNVIPLLEPLLKDDDEDVRSAAASALGDIGSSNAIPLLKPLLRDDIKDVRSAAAEALGNIGTADAIPLLEPLLKDENEWVRSTAAVALGKILTSKDIAFLEILLKNNKGEFRHAAAEALGNIGTANAIPLLESLLKDENEWVRSTAAEALGNIGTANTIPLLESLLKDENEYVRKIAAEALERVGTADAISLLKLLLKDKSGFVRRSAVNALGRIVTAKDIFILAPLLRDNDKWVRSSAAGALGNIGSSDAIPLLEPLLRDEEEYVRSAAIEAMGNISTPNAIPLLELLLRDETSDVRCAAAKAIERIYKRSTPQLAIDDILPRRIEIEPISYSPRSSHPLHILHISDIHYSQQRHPDIGRIFHEFKEDLTRWRQQRNNEKIQAVCLTGDIAYDGNDTQYDSIQERIKDILSTTGCSKNGLFMVPGNHDVQNYENLSQQSQKNLAAAWDNKTNINFNVLSDFQNYREFHEKFTHYHGFIEKYGYQNSRTETQNGVSKPWYSRTLEDYPVRIIGLNSALFGIKDFHEYGKIRMGTNQFTEAYFQGKTGKPSNGELVLLLTHHPLNWLWETEYEEFSTLLERYSVIHLHGHIHRLKIRNLFSFSGSSYLSVGTGSLYGAKGTEDINTYHILTFDFQKQEIRIWARRWVPELGRWSVYADETRNTFPFPRPRVIAWGNDKR
ncbi:MAG: HEAT repeat domain-containing protein, partial [Candidatus Aminicenantes bacterium]